MSGEMNEYDIGSDGEWYEAARELRAAAQSICRRLSWKVRVIGVRPFDQYQGPYCRTTFGSLWLTEVPGIYYHDGIEDAGTPEELACLLRNRVKEFINE